MQHYSSIPEKPLVAGIGKVETPQRVFFFQRSDGSTFATQEQEAWGLYVSGNQVIGIGRDKPKLIGTGEGLIFQKAVQESQLIGRTDIAQAQEIVRKGIADELEACKGKIILPRNYDKFGNGASHI